MYSTKKTNTFINEFAELLEVAILAEVIVIFPPFPVSSSAVHNREGHVTFQGTVISLAAFKT